ncbi:Lar family restriction alleviation protein [Pseudomonas sp. SWRI51]|nr:Lar family restriction alleviation protein [Pseudomonas sp. SWRI51]
MLPCPFCGQQDFLIERLDSDATVVICQGLTRPHEACLARGPVGGAQDEGEEQPGRDKAIELWNARAEKPTLWKPDHAILTPSAHLYPNQKTSFRLRLRSSLRCRRSHGHMASSPYAPGQRARH